MNNWLKMGALALVLGAFGTLSGAALAVPKPTILTPPTKATTASAKGKPGEPITTKGDEHGKGDDHGKPGEAGKEGEHGKGDEHGDKDKDGGSPEPAGSAAAGAPPDEAKIKEIREKAKARMEEHKAKAKEHRAEIKKKVEEKLKGKPMDASMKEELKRNARRNSRLQRAKDVAQEAGDTDTVARIDKLIEKEKARHDKWMAGYDAKPAGGEKKDEKAGEK